MLYVLLYQTVQNVFLYHGLNGNNQWPTLGIRVVQGKLIFFPLFFFKGLAFRQDFNQLFSASKDRSVKIWSLDEMAFVDTL